MCGSTAPCRYVREGTPTCDRCLASGKIKDLLTSPKGTVASWAEPIGRALLATKNPQTTFVWLRRSQAAQVLHRLVSGELALTHETLDGFGCDKSVAHLRELLVACGALPWRNPHVARVEAGIRRALENVHANDRRFIESYARWHVLPRQRARADTRKITSSSVENVVRAINQTARFLTWLRSHETTVDGCSQADIDLWLSDGKLTRRLVRDFVIWTNARGYTSELYVPPLSGPRQPVAAHDQDAQWKLAGRLLRDEDLDVADRVAGILVLLYAQPVSRISQLTTKDVIETEDGVKIRLGRDPVVIPEQFARLVRQLPQQRRRGSAAYLSDPDQWLFPGGRAGHPISRSHLSKRLAGIGVNVRAARTGALLQLAGELPPVALADLLGISINNAVRWVAMASGDWSNYAAHCSQRIPDLEPARRARSPALAGSEAVVLPARKV